MQSTASYHEFKISFYTRLVKPGFMQSTTGNLEFKLNVIFKLLSCNPPVLLVIITTSCFFGIHFIGLAEAAYLKHFSGKLRLKTAYNRRHCRCAENSV